MGGCRCTYRDCKSTTKLNRDLHFFHYPVKHRERCKEWIKNARKPEFLNALESRLRSKVVCDLHFEPKYFTNILRKRLVHNAVPTMNSREDGVLHINLTESEDVQISPANDDGTIFTVDTNSMQIPLDTGPISTYIFQDGAFVPVLNEEESNSEQVVYTIEDDDLKLVSYRASNQTMYCKQYIFPVPGSI